MQASATRDQASPAEVAEQLLSLWHHITRGSSRALYELLAQLDLSITHMKVLHTLVDLGETVQVGHLATDIGLSLPAASRSVDGLTRRGFIERLEDPADRRCRLVGMTAKGRDAVERIDNARLAGLEQFTSSLTAAQRTRLAKALADLPIAGVTT
jgi:DNA-binding MarR family transcriptional regulator